ncbi:MAG: hypothetical protein R2710_12765 [Acidimicrobiales bacterium]
MKFAAPSAGGHPVSTDSPSARRSRRRLDRTHRAPQRRTTNVALADIVSVVADQIVAMARRPDRASHQRPARCRHRSDPAGRVARRGGPVLRGRRRAPGRPLVICRRRRQHRRDIVHWPKRDRLVAGNR